MNIADLIEIALAGYDERQVEVTALEPAEVAMEAVAGLAPLVSELVDNARSFSEPDDRVRLMGLHEQGIYLISISDRGVGIPGPLIAELNRALGDPNATTGTEPTLGISLVARLAARHDIGVRLVPGVPGTTARITVPGRLITRQSGETSENEAHERRLPPRAPASEDVIARPDAEPGTFDMARFQSGLRSGSGVVGMTEEARREAEAFLEKVFAPLKEMPEEPDRTTSSSNGGGNGRPSEELTEEPPSVAPEGRSTITTLRVRVPGENFSPTEDEPSTTAAEGAIDIRSALSDYQQGRQSARKPDPEI